MMIPRQRTRFRQLLPQLFSFIAMTVSRETSLSLFTLFNVILRCFSVFCHPPSRTYSQGQVEYKARSILETLYSMRDIELPRRQRAVPASMPRARTCGGRWGSHLLPLALEPLACSECWLWWAFGYLRLLNLCSIPRQQSLVPNNCSIMQ